MAWMIRLVIIINSIKRFWLRKFLHKTKTALRAVFLCSDSNVQMYDDPGGAGCR